MACSSSNMNSASALVSSVLPTPVGPRNRNEPIGRLGSCRPARARRTASETATSASSWPTTRSRSASSIAQQLLALALQHLLDRHAGPARDHRGDLLGVDHLGGDGVLGGGGLGLGQALLQRAGSRRRRSPRRAAGRRVRWAVDQLGAQAVQRLAGLGGGADLLLLGAPAGGHLVGLGLEVVELVLELLQPGLGGGVGLLASGPRARSSAAPARRSISSSSSGLESTAMRTRLAASSIRSMALSGRKRSVM